MIVSLALARYQVLKYRIPQCREKVIFQDLTLIYVALIGYAGGMLGIW